MAEVRAATRFERADAAELALCLLINRCTRQPPILAFFALVSRLGNGAFWYALLVSLPLLYGRAGGRAALHMGSVALVGVAVYKLLKRWLIRERPFVSWPAIRCGSAPLDQYSFPSGHALHAVAFAVLVMQLAPALGWIVLPFATLVLVSRVVLGLHYPSDVLAGAAIGAALASASLYLL